MLSEFFDGTGLERAAPVRTLVQKLRAGEQFLTRGERCDRYQWQKKGAERVAAVDKIKDQCKPEDFIGYRNRKSTWTSERTRYKRSALP